MPTDMISLKGLPDKYVDMAINYVDFLRYQAEIEKRKEKGSNKKIDLKKFSFKISREALKDLKGNLSDAIIEERRSYL